MLVGPHFEGFKRNSRAKLKRALSAFFDQNNNKLPLSSMNYLLFMSSLAVALLD